MTNPQAVPSRRVPLNKFDFPNFGNCLL